MKLARGACSMAILMLSSGSITTISSKLNLTLTGARTMKQWVFRNLWPCPIPMFRIFRGARSTTRIPARQTNCKRSTSAATKYPYHKGTLSTCPQLTQVPQTRSSSSPFQTIPFTLATGAMFIWESITIPLP